jgi:hypothetical protein
MNLNKCTCFFGRKPGAKASTLTALGFTLALGSIFLIAGASDLAAWWPEGMSVLSPGPIAGKTVYLDQARGYPFCEFEVVMGTPFNLTVQIYNTTGQERCSPAKFDPIDAKALARKLRVDAVVKNPTRYWVMDRLWCYNAGETYDFDGIKATWMGMLKLKADGVRRHGKEPFPAYKEGVITRHSKYEWLKGSQVYLLRSPDGHTWVMQAYTNLVDKSLTEAELPNLGKKLSLPPGWKFEVKTLEKDLTLIPPAKTGYLAHAVSDNFQNIYAGCDFEDTCNYIP